MATYIGLDLGGTNIKISVFDDFFHKLGEKRTPTEVRFGSEHVLNRIYDAVLALLDELHLTCQDITCMGIGVPGILDIKNGISRFSPNFPKWEEVPIVAWMESHLHIPTYIDNDARVNLYGEWKFGAGKNRNNVLMITLGTGLGGAAVIDGRVIYGATGSAGEIGHIICSVKDGNAAAEAPAALGAMFLPSVFCAPFGKKSNWDSTASSVTG